VEIWENENQKVYKDHVDSLAASLGRNIVSLVYSIHVPPLPLMCEPGDFGMDARMASRVAYKFLTIRPRG
jgi:hypothetical protein